MKKTFIYVLSIINIISIIFCFLNLENISNELVFLPLCIIFIFQIFILVKKDKIISLKLTKKEIIMCLFLTVLFLIIMPINSSLNVMLFLSNYIIINIILKIIFVISIFFSLFLILGMLFYYKNEKQDNTTKIRRKIMIIITIISLLFIGSTSTGFYDCDFPYIWLSGNGWSDWHTFAFSFLIYFCKTVFHSTYLVIIINYILYIYFCNYALKILERTTKNKNILILFLCINLFTIMGFDQLRYILKDIIFSFGFCILILTFVDYLISNKFTKGIIINLIVFSIITVLFRHGALYLLIFMYLVFTIFILIRKQYIELAWLAIPLLSFISAYLGINYIGYNILKGGKFPKSVTYTVPIYQVGAFAHDNYEFSLEDKKYLEEYLPIEYMKNNFEKYNGDALARSFSIDKIYEQNQFTFNYNGLIKLNLKLFIDRPVFYVRNLLDLTNLLWKIEVDNDEWWGYLYQYDWTYEYTDSMRNTTIMAKETILNKMVNPIVEVGLKKFLFYFRIRGGFPLFMIIFSSLNFINKRKYVYIIPTLFILCWYIMLFLSLPMGLSRYILPFVNIYPFIFCLSLGIKKTT